MPVKKPVRTRKTSSATTAPSKAPRARKSADGRATWIVGAVALLFVSVAAAAMFASREPSPSPDATMADARERTPAPSPAPMRKTALKDAAAPEAEPPSSGRVSGAVEITGCVQRSDSRFILKDTDGAAAPKARSWKSGFVKKSPASLELNDSGNAAHLSDHVGQRVSVMGTLIDRQMLVQSLRRVAPSCE